MSLKKYHDKRRFDKTPEPRGQRGTAGGALRFVVQKHQASHLHYDFRLELDGVLKSWAVPKGPSLNPADKRLAMMVEDHPLDYRTFEGGIPQGNYGAGTVLVWDEGTYHTGQEADRRERERLLRAGLEKGHLRFVLDGHKLKGEFSLVRLKRGQANAWLLLKKRDEWATDTDVTQDERSVTTGRTLAEVAHKAPKARPASRRARPAAKEQRTASRSQAIAQVKPMLASLVDQPFDRAGWLFEVKWDGYRAIADVGRKNVSLYSRNHKSFSARFAPLVESLSHLGHEAVLDGEIVVVDDEGRSQFQLLQNYQKTGQGRLRYYVFDLLRLDGKDLRGLPLRRRKEMLGKILGGLPDVLLSEHVEDKGVAFFAAATEQGLEGILAKDGQSTYQEGVRGPAWLKIKTHQRQEAVIGGFTEPKGSRKDLGALVLGVYEKGQLVYIGHTGGGLGAAGLRDLRGRLNALIRKTCPFHPQPRTNAPVHWLAPRLVCEVSFQEWTDDGRMRQPIFLGLREDKDARTVRREEARPAPQTSANGKGPTQRHRGPPGQASGKKAMKRPAAVAPSEGPPLTNLGKVYWPAEGITKGDLIAYYRAVAPVLLPYLRDRPQSLHRHPNGITGQSFFQKDVSRRPPPSWVQTVKLAPGSGEKNITYLLCQDEPALLYLANLGCIELNPWNSKLGTLDNPDYLVIDLDPESVPFHRVIAAAVAVHKTLDRLGAPNLCKTSGKRGLHVFVPLGARYDYDQAKQFAELVANLVHRHLPSSTSLVRSPALRQGRVYLDFLQNRRGQTLAAPYSVRPYPGATVSTPLRWREVRKGLDPAKFTLRTVPRRLDKIGDVWRPVLGPGLDLEACLERLGRQ